MSDNDEEYNRLYKKSKRLFNQNKFESCLEALRNAFKLKPSGPLQSKINKIESFISDNNGEDSQELNFKADENKILIDDQYYVNEKSYNLLYSYQKEGVMWLFRLFKRHKGGILADDMGLGKTVQMIFFLRELFESDLIKSALIVMPKSLLINWEREFSKWAPELTVLMYTGNERERNVNKVRRRGGILLTTYGTIMSSWDQLNSDPKFKWNILALDEGHKIKNSSSKTFKTINALRADIRIVMTGTAVQNKLKELWALFDFTHQGSLLGNYPTFMIEYEKPITSSRNKDATQTEKIYGDEIAKSLKNLIKPYFLRRTKEEVTKQTGHTNTPTLKRKNDLIVWVKMTDIQINFYQNFLELDEIKLLLTMSEKRSPLVELNILKKICDHPRLLRPEHCAEMGMSFAGSIEEVDIRELQRESGKMEFLLLLLNELVRNNHKCLVFSQSKVVLNIIQRILTSNDIKQLRLDGDIIKPIDRQQIVDSFNNDPSYKVLLLTSQVGGVGLTLTGADRAIIYDLSWNPSIDAQAVDRLYRIGQLQNVVVYRLITCGTIEEKIYRRQIFKDSVNRQTTGIQSADKNPTRYFTTGELLELFILDDPLVSKTQRQLEEMHSQFRKSDKNLDEHIEWLNEQNIFGISDHDLMFSQEEKEISEVDQETRDRILAFKQQAEDRLLKESQINAKPEEGELRQMMSKMSLNDYKSKAKEKHLSETMFIPSSSDLKRPVHHIMQPFQRQIPEYFQPINLKKPSKVEYIQISDEDDVIIVDDDNKNKKDVENLKKSMHIDEKMKFLEYEEGDDTYVYEEFEDKSIGKAEEENTLKIISKQFNEFVTNEDDYLHNREVLHAERNTTEEIKRNITRKSLVLNNVPVSDDETEGIDDENAFKKEVSEGTNSKNESDDSEESGSTESEENDSDENEENDSNDNEENDSNGNEENDSNDNEESEIIENEEGECIEKQESQSIENEESESIENEKRDNREKKEIEEGSGSMHFKTKETFNLEDSYEDISPIKPKKRNRLIVEDSDDDTEIEADSRASFKSKNIDSRSSDDTHEKEAEKNASFISVDSEISLGMDNDDDDSRSARSSSILEESLEDF